MTTLYCCISEIFFQMFTNIFYVLFCVRDPGYGAGGLGDWSRVHVRHAEAAADDHLGGGQGAHPDLPQQPGPGRGRGARRRRRGELPHDGDRVRGLAIIFLLTSKYISSDTRSMTSATMCPTWRGLRRRRRRRTGTSTRRRANYYRSTLTQKNMEYALIDFR